MERWLSDKEIFMNDQLMTLSKIFTERIFRIPDYQRGYAWTQKEVSEFWNDLLRLNENSNHYVGVLTLEPVKEDIYKTWIDDLWLIDSKKYAPYYVVDGQQRLTNSILLIKSIINVMKKHDIHQLNYTEISDISRRFISESKGENKSCTYLFGYELNNPSYLYLTKKIYEDNEDDLQPLQETTYTLNLINALAFFEEKLDQLSVSELECVYKKITQHFLFNTYEISSDIDVFVTFETMNNRGKPLSHLELLKNRLIYLSTLFNVSSDIKARLRRDINVCWKDIYHILGQGKTNYLPDDEFLDAHFHLYFCNQITEIYKNYRRKNSIYFGSNVALYNYLLEEHFVASKVSANLLSTNDIINYINSLEKCIQIWFIINNPEKSKYKDETIEYLRKINYLLTPRRPDSVRHLGVIKANSHKVLLLACLQKNTDETLLLKFLKSFEKFLFLCSFIPFECYDRNYELVNLDVNDILRKLDKGDLLITGVKEKIDRLTNNLIEDERINKNVISYYSKFGFYDEDFLRYFLCEYELHLQNISKTKISKLDRDVFFGKGYDSIEHIYPQRARHSYWLSQFEGYSQKQKTALRNSLGNFVAVSQVKNGRLANLPFPEKRDGKANHIGYRYGTYAEIELTENSDWGADEILKRGLKLITFLQDRWGYKIGRTKEDKINFLGLSFLAKNK